MDLILNPKRFVRHYRDNDDDPSFSIVDTIATTHTLYKDRNLVDQLETDVKVEEATSKAGYLPQKQLSLIDKLEIEAEFEENQARFENSDAEIEKYHKTQNLK